MASKTIKEAIIEVLKQEGKALSSKEIVTRIKEQNLYQFKSKSADNIVNSQLRRHSVNVTLNASSKIKLFKLTDLGNYELIKP